MKTARCLLAMVLAWHAAAMAEAAEKYVAMKLKDVKVLEGKIPEYAFEGGWRWSPTGGRTYVALDGAGEAYVFDRLDSRIEETQFVARVAEGQNVSGLMFVSDERGKLHRIKFEAANSDEKSAKETFLEVKANYYQTLLNRQLPGAAWFRHQEITTLAELGRKEDPNDRRFNRRVDDFDADVFALFSGGRAVSENLQLSRTLREGSQTIEPDSVDVSTLQGITIQAIDWKPLLKEMTTPIDPLAATIPADQHVVFFRTFKALVRMADESEQQGTPLLRLAEPRSEDARTLARYERQLGLSMSGLGRLLGPKVIDSVALTGSDVDFRLGTDMAILFETANPSVLENLLAVQMGLAHGNISKAKAVNGTVDGVRYRGSLSDDRQASSYVASLKGAVVVTNSLAQLKRLVEVQNGKSPAIATLEEFRFFRQRYPRSEEETAFLFLSDATIRRWCGPRWRIASARRLKAAATLTESHAEQIDRLVKGESGPVELLVRSEIDLRDLQLTRGAVRSSRFGSTDFITPIVEMPLESVTKSEAEAYEQWRRGYEQNWRWAFDPIALRVVANDRRLAGDLTVMPLIAGTEYRSFIRVSQGAKLKPDAGDPHDALWHIVLALNPESELLKQGAEFASSMSGTLRLNPLSWLGGSIAVYMDDDPIFAQLAKRLAAADPDEPYRDPTSDLEKLPFGIRIEVRNSLKFTAFLAGLRAYIEQTAPDRTVWENLTHNGMSYVKVSSKDDNRPGAEQYALYYAPMSDSLTVTLNEGVIKRALDRQKVRLAAAKAVEPASDNKTADQPQSWVGENLALRVESKGWSVLMNLDQNASQKMMQQLAWNNLPILNEWHRRWPDQDPVDIHLRVWGVKLLCPGGGKYVWNDQWKTMESTLYGHPGEPKQGPTFAPLLEQFTGGDFGVTFEPQGLRARVEVRRAEKK